MRLFLTALLGSLLLGGCGTMTQYDTNQAVSANPDCLVGDGALGESSACRRESGVRFGEKSEKIDLSGARKDEKKPL